MADSGLATSIAPNPPRVSGSLPPLALAPLIALSAAKLVIQFAGITHYGFFRDELYYMACGRHLAWGYIDQPPLIAFVAWFARHVFGDSIIALRILPVLAGAAVVFLTGVLARELGGGRLAQILAAVTILLAPAYLAFDSFFSMNAFEPLFWLACALIAVRIARGASPRLWLAFGAISGIGLENKHTMAVFGFGVIAGLLLTGNAAILRSKWLWFGGLIALALAAPNLVWESRHGWPQIGVVRNAQEYKNVQVGPLRFLGEQLLLMSPVSLPIWGAGLARLFAARDAQRRRFRFLGWSYVIVLAIFMVFDGKAYYVLPVYTILAAAGAVAWEGFSSVLLRRLRTALVTILVLAGLATIPFGVPLLPVDTFLRYMQAFPGFNIRTERDATAPLPQLYADMFGWRNLAETVARVYHALPAGEQASCAILGGNYGEAGAIDYYGPALGLPPAIGGHNSYFDWGPRNYSGECVILIGERADRYKEFFAESQLAAVAHNPHAMPVEQNVVIYVCRKPRAPLSTLWPNFRMII
ncbi:MAG TPA: glycosyltransferase family 39 protein [Candidatus Limnocylindrales bacterium]|nr:glycosyltransferase family 39 protein [Candidatus Limnocylindrales bacterium]